MDLISILKQQIEQNALQNKAFLIGLSGGVDSTVLLHLFVRLAERMPLKFRAMHIHHGISPNADHWLNHCRQLCQQFNVPFSFEKVQLQQQRNIEAQARQVRYQAIQQHLMQDNSLNLKGFYDYSLRKQRYLLRYWFAHLQQPMPSQKQLQVLLDEVVGAKNDRQPELQLNQKVVRRYQQQLYLTPIYQDLRTIKLPIQSGESVRLPDNLGELRCDQQSQQLCFTWQQQQLILPLPQVPYRITVGFHYSKTVKIKANAKHTDIKKVWQMLAVPPWQRNRIPLIFINEQLKGAVGYFIVV